MTSRRFCENCGYTAPYYRFRKCEQCGRLICSYCRVESMYFCDHGNPIHTEPISAETLVSDYARRHVSFRSPYEDLPTPPADG